VRARVITVLAAVLPALALTVAAGPQSAGAAGSASGSASGSVSVRRACSARPAAGRDQCQALIRTGAGGQPLVSHAVSPASPPSGYGPGQLQSAYELATAAAVRGTRQIVAVVDAYDDPNAQTDLIAYRAEYGLPPCTSASGCFRKVNQAGAASPLPAASASWALEESLDIEMVSAICPRCHIILAEATDNQDYDMAATVASAARLGATEISNSYAEPEYPGETRLEPFYSQPGVQITASAGDYGYGVSYPAASAGVTSVGGTALWPVSGGRGWTETAWAGSGSGCSTQISKPAWQHDACTHRTDNDAAAVADPQTAVAVYDTFGAGGWVEAGGTSVSAPIIAAYYALLGDPRAPAGSWFYAHRSRLFDVMTGANGTCYPAYLCTAGRGYDGPTGLGTPDYTGAPATSRSCVSDFTATPPQQAPGLDQVLLGQVPLASTEAIEALSRHNVWTVGTYDETNWSGPAASTGWLSNIEHWTGSRWSQTPSADPVTASGQVVAELTGVSFDRPGDGWAVGESYDHPIAEHWNGRRWSLSPVLQPVQTYMTASGQTGPMSAVPLAVTAIARDDVWLVGDLLENAPSGVVLAGSFAERWNGRTWTLVTIPDSGQVLLTATDAVSAHDIWAVGSQTDSAGNITGPAVLHWDGRAWSSVMAPAGHPVTVLNGVSAAGPDDIWAVGLTYSPAAGKYQPMAEHWDGTGWSLVSVAQPPSVTSTGNELTGVTAISADDAWAVGTYGGQRAGQFERRLYLLEHWDGQRWTMVGAPATSVPDGLVAVSAAPGHGGNDVWIAGSQQVQLSSPASYFADYPVTLHRRCRHD